MPCGVEKQAEEVKLLLQGTFENLTVEIEKLSPVFIAQGGPGCIAIQAIRK